MAGTLPYTGAERRGRPVRASNPVNDFLDRVQAKSVPGRLFLFFLTAQTAWLAFVPGSMVSRIYSGIEIGCIAALAIAVLGLIDTIINDVLPDCFALRCALSIRHMTLMLCAAFFASGAFMATQVTGGMTVAPYFVACCLFISQHAFFDIRRRFKARR